MADDLKTIVAVDLGTKSGIAWSTGDDIETTAFDFSKVRQMGAGMRPLMLRQELLTLFERLSPIDQVVFENVERHSATYAAQIFGELRGCLMSVCEEMDIPYRGLSVTRIKKHVTGSGICKKDVTREAIAKLWPHIPVSDLTEDEVDALSILKCALDKVI
ncbi:MAG: hypothetical protein Unbinned1190contig1000_30 [Prokaryotic dsDNA virus sp.]|nr:MAG: hypothetical protein Unbinned1190contig1000_30 [Prokaryotic dsDNA virus sp.]|tara:strand:- start:5384 stop:5863 length:480 start_codon:yes stop_codon:yes gene_type:complete